MFYGEATVTSPYQQIVKGNLAFRTLMVSAVLIRSVAWVLWDVFKNSCAFIVSRGLEGWFLKIQIGLLSQYNSDLWGVY